MLTRTVVLINLSWSPAPKKEFEGRKPGSAQLPAYQFLYCELMLTSADVCTATLHQCPSASFCMGTNL
jgi:hypothetical protein